MLGAEPVAQNRLLPQTLTFGGRASNLHTQVRSGVCQQTLHREPFASILPLSVARHHVSRGRMRVLPLAPLEPLGEVVLVWRADTSAPAADLFSECLRESS